MRPKYRCPSVLLLLSRAAAARTFALAGLWLIAVAAACAQMQSVPEIIAVAGTGTAGYSGDSGLATSAKLSSPGDVAFDSAGNMYIADYGNCRIREVTIATGNISTVAGNGTCGYNSDGIAATSAELNGPNSVAIDNSGNVYIADYTNNRIRKVTISTGFISTVAGTGTASYSGDGAAATSAALNTPSGVAVDSSGNIYIADRTNDRVRKVTISTGYISTVAGNGSSCGTPTSGCGDGSAATSANLTSPNSVALDSSGNIYIADSGDNRVREVTISSGYISTVAGNGTPGYTGDGAAATSAEINGPNGAALDSSGNVYISDTQNRRIRVVNPGTGHISTLAGNGTQGATGNGGPAISAELDDPKQITVNGLGNVYLADATAEEIRQVPLNTSLPATALGGSSAVQNFFLQTTAAETLTSFIAQQSQGSKQEYTIGTVTGCTVNGSTSNPSGTICTLPITFTPAYPGLRNVPLTAVTGTGNVGFGLTGTGAGPLAVLIPGIISTVAGDGTAGSTGNGGAATSAELNDPAKVAVDSAGNVYIANYNNQDIQKVTASSGNISIVAGNGTSGYLGDGGAATGAEFKHPSGLGVDSAGNIYIADKNNCRIRKVTVATGVIATVAGTSTCGYTGDGGLATSGEIHNPSSDIAVDSYGNWYFGDNSNYRIRVVNASTGIITTVAGNGTQGYTGDGSAATSAEINNPSGVALDSSGNIYFSDFNAQVIRKVTVSTGIISTVAGTGTAGYSGDGGPAIDAEINFPGSLTVDLAANIYILDINNRVRVVNAASGIISTLAGNGTGGYAGDGGPATSAELNIPADIALDSAGNMYIGDSSNNVIRKVNVSQSQLTYPTSTAVGTMDGTDDPQTATVANIGNASLTISVPGTGNNPSVSAYFELDNATTCPELNTSSSSATLAAGGVCNYAVDFAPTIAGVVTGSVILTDNTLGVTGSTQTISLTATAIAVNTTTTVTSSVNPSAYSGSVTFTATVAAVSGTAACTGTVQFSVDSTNVGGAITLSGGTATYTTSTLTTGTHSVIAAYTTNSSCNSSTSSTLTQTVNKATPTVSVWPTVSSITYGQTLASSTLTGGTASVGGSFAWTTASTGPGAGTPSESVTFTPNDTTNYNTVSGSIAVTVNKAALAITASSATVSYGGGVPTITPSYSGFVNSQTSSVLTTQPTCTTTYTATSAAGSSPSTSCSGAAAANYAISYVAGVVTVNQAPLTITASSTTVSYGAAVPTITPSYSAFVNSQTSSVLTTAPTCTTTYTVTSAAGSSPSTSCSGAAAANYAISYVAGVVTVNQAPLTITASSSTVSYGAAVPTITPTYSAFVNSQTSGVLTTQPTCTTTYTTASAAGSSPSTSCSGAAAANYAISYVAGVVTVNQAPLTITASSSTVNYGAAVPTITPSYSAFANSQTSSVLTTQPTCTTTYTAASAAGSSPPTTCSGAAAANYSISYVAGTVTVNQAPPTITFSVSNQTYGVSPFTVSATSNSAGAITYSVVSGPATISGSTVTISAIGTVVLQASQAANGNYTAGTQNASFTVSAAAPAITFTVSNQTYGVAPFTVSATSNSAGAITYSVLSGPATISGSTVTISAIGTVVLQASQAANGNYTAGTQNASFTVSAAAPAITFTISNQTYGVAPFAVSATSNSAGAITYSVVSGPATLSGSTVTITGVGTVVLQASQAANGNYTAATQNASFTVSAAAPAITFTISNQTYGVAPFAVAATSNSAGAITYSVVSGPATLSGSAVTITGVGTVVLQASQAANGNYTAGTQNASFTVSAAAPTITFTVSNQTYGVAPFAVSATSNSAGAITYSVVSGPATISGSTVTISAIGTVVLQAAQAANGNYTAGTQNASFTVSKATPTVALSSSSNPSTYNGSVTFTATVPPSATGIVTFLDGATSIGTGSVSSGAATFTMASLSGGSHSITAQYGGNSNYNAATSSAVTEVVDRTPVTVSIISTENPSIYWDMVTFTFTFTGSGSAIPTGTATITEDSNALATVSLDGTGTATYSTSATTAGSHNIKAAYNGDDNYQ